MGDSSEFRQSDDRICKDGRSRSAVDTDWHVLIKNANDRKALSLVRELIGKAVNEIRCRLICLWTR